MAGENSKLTPDKPDITGEKQAKKRDVNGRFMKGYSGNPEGRPKEPPGNTLQNARALLNSNAAAIVQKVIDVAADEEYYDIKILKLCLDRIIPARKDAPVTFELPPIRNIDDLAEAQIAIMRAVASGDLTPLEGKDISAMTEKILKTLKERET